MSWCHAMLFINIFKFSPGTSVKTCTGQVEDCLSVRDVACWSTPLRIFYCHFYVRKGLLVLQGWVGKNTPSGSLGETLSWLLIYGWRAWILRSSTGRLVSLFIQRLGSMTFFLSVFMCLILYFIISLGLTKLNWVDIWVLKVVWLEAESLSVFPDPEIFSKITRRAHRLPVFYLSPLNAGGYVYDILYIWKHFHFSMKTSCKPSSL